METVLLVEEQAVVRYVLAEALLDNGFDVIEARNASEALRLAPSHSGSVTALITEVHFSSIAVEILARELKLFNPKLKILIVSTLRNDELPTGLQYDAVLQKLRSSQQILSTLDRMLYSGLATL